MGRHQQADQRAAGGGSSRELGWRESSASAWGACRNASHRNAPTHTMAPQRWRTVCGRLCSARRRRFWFWVCPQTENRELVVIGIAMTSCAYMIGLCVRAHLRYTEPFIGRFGCRLAHGPSIRPSAQRVRSSQFSVGGAIVADASKIIYNYCWGFESERERENTVQRHGLFKFFDVSLAVSFFSPNFHGV